jgi:hypothetical protein
MLLALNRGGVIFRISQTVPRSLHFVYVRVDISLFVPFPESFVGSIASSPDALSAPVEYRTRRHILLCRREYSGVMGERIHSTAFLVVALKPQ